MAFVGEGSVRLATALLCLLVMGADCQENANKKLSPSLLECYEGELYEKWNLLPHNIDTLVGIIRKIESYPGLNMDMRSLSTALLHRFRQDGIERNPEVRPQVGITPYAILGKEFYRFQQTLRVIPGNAFNFPNDSLSALERCTLHSMLSSSVNKFERGDESRVCKVTNYSYRRFWRSADDRDAKADAESLTPHQLESLRRAERADPNAMYPPFPPNHPSSARLVSVPLSRCPIQNGVVKTPWGAVSGGSVLAGIAASLEPQLVNVGDLMKHQVESRMLDYPSELNLDNKFIGTLAGDLAEVAVRQGPLQSDRFVLGADGNWNSTSTPLHYFLGASENLEMTAADIRGDLDGLILASQVPVHYSRFSGLRLSQVLDMYYGERGLFDRSYRACNRRSHYLRVAPTETLISQTHSSGVVLSPGIASVTLSSEAIEKFAVQAVKELSSVIPTMNSDSSCEHNSNSYAVINEAAVDLTIFLDTTWPFDHIKPILLQLLSRLDMNYFNSNFTIVNGMDGSFIIDTSYDSNTLNMLNSTYYNSLSKGFDFSRSLKELRNLQWQSLNEEKRIRWGGGRSNVVLFVPNQNRVPQNDKEYCLETLQRISEEVPDAVLLFLTYGPKDAWSEYVRNSDTDLFSISISETSESYPFLDALQARIKQVPRRLINSHCGANYQSGDSSGQVTEYVPPNGVNYYRIHPNYFSSSDTENPPKIRIQGSGASPLKICTSRELMHVNVNQDANAVDCTSITGNAYTVTMNCDGTSYLHECKPYYFAISTNSTSSGSYFCTDSRVCRYPDNVKYTISYENLICQSGSSTLLVMPMLLLLLLLITQFL